MPDRHSGSGDRVEARLVLAGVRLPDGQVGDIVVNPQSGRIDTVGSHTAIEGDEVLDARGLVATTTAVDPHAHLDKALWTRHLPEMPATLDEAVATWIAQWPHVPTEDFVARATEALDQMVARGTTVVRTHVDVGTGVGVRAVEALVAVRDAFRVAGRADVQVVALAAPPLGGEAGAAHRRLLEAAIEAGADVVGGSPDLDPDPASATAVAVDVAAATGRPLDLHTDQTVDPGFFFLPELVRLVRERELRDVVASHCISLVCQPEAVQQRVAAEMAELGIAVTTMPLTSLFYFGWDHPTAPPRGLTAVRVLRDEGVVVAAGGDNVQDVFFPLGRFDPLETTAVATAALHLDLLDAWSLCTSAGRRALGLAPTTVAPGEPADLLLLKGSSLAEALALGSEHRVVVKAGRIVSRTTVTGGLQ